MTSALLPLPQVDRSLCIGYGLCMEAAPHYFELADDGFSQVREVAGVDPADAETVRAAVAACPMQAISWDAPDA